MEYNPADIDNRLRFFSELLSYDSNCYLWTYTADGALVSTNCPKLVLDTVFRRSSCYEYMLMHAQESDVPLMMSSTQDLAWGAVFETEENQLERIHVLGPIHTHTVSTVDLERAAWGKITPRWKPKYLKIMESLPIINTVMFSRRILMMQYCVTNEWLLVSDIVMQRETIEEIGRDLDKYEENGIFADRIQVYMAEQSLLSMIRNGDMNYKDAVQKATRFFTGKQQLSDNPLQHAKLGQVQFIALCCNAALEGGLSAETAYNRKDAYIRDVENAKSISEISEIGKSMFADYIALVHRQLNHRNYSKAVQSTCDYIENHLDKNLSAEVLASRVGYSAYYLSRLFKKETGVSIDEYARNIRIERAKVMLSSSGDSIQDIAEELGFGGRNYFAVTFKKATGMPPAAYRKEHRRL